MTASATANSNLKTARQRRGILLTVGGVLIFILLVLALFINKITTPRVISPLELRANGTLVFEQPRIINDFQLLDQRGEGFNLESLKGKWSLLFFGFTHCPDVCPATLAVLRDVKAQMDSDLVAQTNFVLVTVDPARDTVAQLAQYMPYFDPDFIGLTGEFLQIKRLANQLNMAFVKVKTGAGSDDYSVDHSANIAIINPYGHYHGFIKSPPDTARVKLTLQSIISSF